MWAFTRGAEAELLVNGESQGRVAVETFGHAAWPAVPYAAGSLECRAFLNAGDDDPAAVYAVETTGGAAALRLSVRDGQGSLPADGGGVALLVAEVVDAEGRVVPVHGDVDVTFAVAAAAMRAAAVVGTGSGDPADHTPDKSATRPAFHGLALAVVAAVDGAAEAGGAVEVEASAPGLGSASVTLAVVAPSSALPRL